MAVTVAAQTPRYYSQGNVRKTLHDITFDSSYESGGEPLTAAQLGLRKVLNAECNITAVGGTVDVAEASYAPATELVHLFDQTPAEVASGDVSGVVVQVAAEGY